MQLSFNIDQFERLFPFHLLLNRDLQIVLAGKSLQKLISIPPLAPFTSFFHLQRPQTAEENFAALLALQNQLVVIQSKTADSFLLRGQLEQIDHEMLLYIGSPWLASMDEVKQRNLLLNDFAYHDPMIDLLHVIKTQEIAASEVRQLLTTVNEQRNALKQASKAVSDIALFPMQNPDPLVRIDFNGTVILENPAAEKLPLHLTYGGQVFETKSFWKNVIGKIRNGDARSFLEVEAEGRYYSFACIALEEEGYINIYGRDITNQELLDRNLKRTANRLTTLISNLQSAVLLENENRTIALVNQMFCNMFHIPVAPELLIGSDCSQAAEQTKHLFKNPDTFVERIAEILQNKVTVTGDKLELLNGKILRRDFIPIWNNNQYFGHMWVYEDITEVETREQALTEQKAFYEEILNKIPADIAVFDKEHRYLFLNPVAVKDENLRRWLIGKTDEDYAQYKNKPQKLVDERRAIFNAVKESKKLLSFEERLLQADGSEIYQLRNFNPVLNEEGEVELMIGYGLNITERKKMEQALEKARAEAEQSSVMKDRFFATMSHEIRTPLNGIMGVTELLGKTELTDKQQEFISIIKMSEAHLLRIVNEVLDFEKITRNEIILEETEFDVIKLITDICSVYRVNAAERNLAFNLVRNADALFVKADSYRFSQVIHNLLGNAVKFTQQGSITVAVNLEKMSEEQAVVRISIADTGIGIGADMLTTIFEPYAQGKSAIAKQYGGTGLGLSICKRLVDLQGGVIEVESEENKGSVFTVSYKWPIVYTTQSATEDQTETSVAMTKNKLRVLIAEDVAINQFLLKHLLEKQNVYFFVTDNGLQAVEEVKRNEYDVVLMDIEMPFMDGVEATREIRKLDDRSKANIPIIALTANAIKGKREEYLAAGMNDFITKPFSEQQLTEALNKISTAKTQKTNTATPKLYNLSYLQSLSDDREFIQKMITVFLESTPVMLAELEAAVGQYSYNKAATVLHKLKPAAATIGMLQLKAEIAAIEQEIKFGTVNADIHKRMVMVIKNFNDCIVELRTDFM